MIKLKTFALILLATISFNISAQNTKSQNKNTVWFITGCDKGLGATFAKGALHSGYRVVATGLNADSVRQSVGDNSENLLVAKCDIRNDSDIKKAVNLAIEKFGHINILLNNAGYGQIGWFENTTDRQIRDQFETNVFGTMNVTRAVLPHMRQQQSGKILTITSVAGLIAASGSSVYSASKFAVEGWMEGLLNEVKSLGITGMIIEPGFFRTDFLDASSIKYPENNLECYASLSAEFKLWHDNMNHNQMGDPKKLAAIVIKMIAEDNHPLRFVAGTNASKLTIEKIESISKELQKWHGECSSTDGDW